MKSKRLVYVLIACLCLMLCGCEKNLDNTQQSKNTAVSSAQEAAANGFEYEVCDAYVKITGCSKSEPAVSVPETINGKPVKVIGEEAFYGQTDMSEIHLPFGLEVIENGAFYRCSALKSVNIPESVTQIGNDVFSVAVLCKVLRLMMKTVNTAMLTVCFSTRINRRLSLTRRENRNKIHYTRFRNKNKWQCFRLSIRFKRNCCSCKCYGASESQHICLSR